MTTVKGVFDGQSIKLLEPPPSTQPSAVTVTFLADENVTVKESPAAYGTRSASSVALADLVDKVRLVLDTNGKPVALQIDMADWSALMDWLEDVEDAQLIRARLRQRSERAATQWEDFEAELKADGLL
jgi:PHD/YefM family antitoxin component YafN of YafNO toxin-antitoxin module